jgi:flagellar hook-basal body complex protein FliE
MNGLTIENNVTAPVPTLKKEAETRGTGFGESLKKAIQETNTLQNKADTAAEQVIKGHMGIHEGMLAMGKADIALRLLATVRNKVMAAYQEIMRMPA